MGTEAGQVCGKEFPKGGREGRKGGRKGGRKRRLKTQSGMKLKEKTCQRQEVRSDPCSAAVTRTCPVAATKSLVYSQREINNQLLLRRLQDNNHTSCLRGSSHFQ